MTRRERRWHFVGHGRRTDRMVHRHGGMGSGRLHRYLMSAGYRILYVLFTACLLTSRLETLRY